MNFLSELSNALSLPVVALGCAAGLLIQSLLWVVASRQKTRRFHRELMALEQKFREEQARLEKRLEETLESQNQVAGELRSDLSRLNRIVLSAPAAPPASRPPLDKKRYVMTLAQQGLGVEDISRRLKLHRGETELLLGLRNLTTKSTNPETVLQ